MDIEEKYQYQDNYPYSMGGYCIEGVLRSTPSAFDVTEQLGFEPLGDGNHLWLYIEKIDANTDWVAKQLARFAKLSQVAIGYAGLKDRRAITRQWFSLDLSGKKEPSWEIFEQQHPMLKILDQKRHTRKLKRGALKANQFKISVVHEAGRGDCIAKRIEQITNIGVPNYFGPQRFGRNGDNVIKAVAALTNKKRLDRHTRSVYISALRSFLFNQVLARRVEENNWHTGLDGDVFILDGTNSIFHGEENETQIQQRLDSLDIHITGPLWGEGPLSTHSLSQALEQSTADKFFEVTKTINSIRNLTQDRRSLRLRVDNLHADIGEKESVFFFELPPGGYATSVLREIFFLKSA